MPPRRPEDPPEFSEEEVGPPSPENVSFDLMGFASEDDGEDPSVIALRTDSYEDSNLAMDPRLRMPSEARSAAPEVSAGAWRERAFAPRGTMPREQVVMGMSRALQTLELQRLAPEVLREDLLNQWQPFLRQAVEQVGGDGLDAHLLKILRPPGRPARDRFLADLCAAMKRLQLTKQREAVFTEGKKILKLVQTTLTTRGRKLSLKVLESELEGRLDVGVMLSILFSTPQKLKHRIEQVDSSAESLRTMLRSMPGHHPDGMMWNYARLKVERRVVAAELAVRG